MTNTFDDSFDFEEFDRRLNEPGSWVYIAPVSGVTLTEAVNNEFHIQRVVFVSQSKLPRIRARLGIPQRISAFKRKDWVEFFGKFETFAVVQQTGDPEQAKTTSRKLVRDGLAILSTSQLGFSKRQSGANPSIGESHGSASLEALINTKDQRKILEGKRLGKLQPLVLDWRWNNYHKKMFFYKLLDILNRKTMVEPPWRDDLKRAAILIGQSQCSSDLAQAFLWNMIVLDLLLMKQGDKYDVFPKGIEAFLGWIGFWEVNGYTTKIKEVYRKRNALVHAGKRDEIAVEDLLFTDDLLLNLLINIVHHPELFSSKEHIIGFAAKVEAEHLLEITSIIRPKTLRFVAPLYSEKDLREI